MKEALKLALEALERGETKLRWEAITAIKEALAQPEHSATYQKINLSLLKHSDNCRFWDEGDLCTCGASEFHELQFWKNKALAQPNDSVERPWVGLTDEERSEIYNRMDWVIDFDWEYELAIEAKLKEKNT